MPESTRPSLLIIEDESDISAVLEINFAAEGYAVRCCGDGLTGLRTALEQPPDVVLLDIMLPGLDGLEVCRALKAEARTRGIPIIIVSARGRESDVVLGLGLGADDYVTKPFSIPVLLARVKAALRRRLEVPAPDGRLSFGPFCLDPQRHEFTVDTALVDLTATEFRLMESLLQSPGRVFTREALIALAIGDDVIVGERTIDTHIGALRKKLGNHRSCIRTIWGVGFRLEPAEASH